MRQWKTLFKKELLENWRNYKLIWVPLVIILLAIMDPITTYYLPLLIENFGGLPEGAIFEIPVPDSAEVMMMSLSQINSLGILILVLISMGTITGEYKSGVAELILVKPISALNYITSKWCSYILLTVLSLSLALLTSWYYINLLFGELLFSSLLKTLFFSSLSLILVITIVIFYNILVKTPGLVAGLSLGTIIGFSIITSVFDRYLAWSPTHLTGYIYDMIVSQKVSNDLVMTSIITIILICIMLTSAIFTFKKNRLFI